MTYGQLMDQAKQELSRCLSTPITIPSTADTLLACDARARLYRVVAGGLTLHLNLPRSAGLQHFVEYRGESINRREATLLEQLRSDLRRSARTPGDTATVAGTLQTSTAATTAARLTRAADTAGAGFDLLAGHLTSGSPPRPDSTPLRRGGPRVTARDAVQLAVALAHLDNKLEAAIRSQARPDLDEQSRRRLVTTADDCKRVTRRGVHEFATAIQQALRTPARQHVDDLDLAAPATARLATPAQPSTAADLVAELRRTAHPRPEQLSIADLAAVASIGSRVCALTAYAGNPIGGPVGPALATARRWRGLYQHLVPFTTTSHGRDLIARAHRFRSWADPIIRGADQIEFPRNTWLPAIQSMTTDLTDLAYAVTKAITSKATAGDLLVPFDPGTRGREHLYTPAKPTDQRVVQLRQAAADTNRSARDLAHAVHDLDPPTHPRPSRARKAAGQTPRQLRPAASRTAPPLPRLQVPRHLRR